MLTTGTTIAVLTRVDLVVADPKRVRKTARNLTAAELPAEHPEDGTGQDLYRALAALVSELGGDILHEQADLYGLVAGDSSTVLINPPDNDDWQDAWPPNVQKSQILLAIDTGLDCEIAEHLT